MPIEVACPSCGANYQLRDEYAGRRVKCPACQTVIAVPAVAPKAPPPFELVDEAEERPPARPARPARPAARYDRDEPEGRRPARRTRDDYDHDDEADPRPARRTRDAEYDLDDDRPGGTADDPIFGRDKFLLRQKLWTIKEKYTVTDDDGQPILYVERPVFLTAGCLAIFAGLLVMGVVIGGAIYVGVELVKGDAGGVIAAIGGILGFVAGIAVIIALYPKRHIGFYTDKRMEERVLHVSQDQKLVFINMWYTLRDDDGEVICRFRKNYLYNIFRKRWYIYRPDGELWCVVKEDSVILSLLRRTVGAIGDEIPLLGLALAAALRTNFIFTRPDDDEQLGMFNRRLTLLDRYVLDMEDDPKHQIDRRVAVAMGVLLDTGEGR